MTCGGENGTNGSHFPVLSEDVAFARHFVATRPLPALPPCRSATVIGYPSKKLSKMAGNPTSYPVYTTYNELTLNSYRFVEKYVQVAPIILEIY